MATRLAGTQRVGRPKRDGDMLMMRTWSRATTNGDHGHHERRMTGSGGEDKITSARTRIGADETTPQVATDTRAGKTDVDLCLIQTAIRGTDRLAPTRIGGIAEDGILHLVHQVLTATEAAGTDGTEEANVPEPIREKLQIDLLLLETPPHQRVTTRGLANRIQPTETPKSAHLHPHPRPPLPHRPIPWKTSSAHFLHPHPSTRGTSRIPHR